MYTAKPAYRLSCRRCPWIELFHFDERLPELCRDCNCPRPKIESLETKTEMLKS